MSGHDYTPRTQYFTGFSYEEVERNHGDVDSFVEYFIPRQEIMGADVVFLDFIKSGETYIYKNRVSGVTGLIETIEKSDFI